MSSQVTPHSIIALSVVLTSLSILTVSLRFYTRKVQKSSFRLDDWLTVPALICLIVSAISYIIGASKYQLGSPTDNNLPGAAEGLSSQIVYAYKAEFITLIIQPLLLGFIKSSIIFFYRRIFCFGSPTVFSTVTIVVIAITVIWAIAFFLALLLPCGKHIAVIWGSFQDYETYCHHVYTLDEVYAITDFILDVVVFIMPLPMTWNLHMSVQRRLAVTLVFVIGALAIVASCIRMTITILIALGKLTIFGTTDTSLQTAIFLYWAMFEQGIAVIVACLPTLWYWLSNVSVASLVRSVRTRLFLESLRTRTSQFTLVSPPSEKPQTSKYILTGSETAITKPGEFDMDLEGQQGIEIPITSRRQQT